MEQRKEEDHVTNGRVNGRGHVTVGGVKGGRGHVTEGTHRPFLSRW